MLRLRGTAVLVAAATVAASGCAQLGLIGDGTSVSVGWTSDGRTVDPARLPDAGEGYWTPPTWRLRGARYGSDELVDLIAAVGRRVAAGDRRVRLGVADLSSARGGDVDHHASHESGRDVDLLLFYTDAAGRPVQSDAMVVLSPEGVSASGALKLDVRRSWALIRALVTAREAEVQRIFFAEPLIQLVLDHARAIGEPEAIVQRARDTLRQPSDSAPHDDHMHVRIFCPTADIAYGCIDSGVMDVQGKEPPRLAALTPEQRAALTEPMPAMLALVGWAALR
jgi:penicillin-insensitive murein endopeptidase